MLDAKMKDKVTSVVLCAVLVFYAMVPISDFQKPQKAEAIAPAIAAVTVFGTALTAMGVYVAGSTAAGYNANLGALYDGFQSASAGYSDSWAQYVQDQGSFDAAMQSAVTADGNISLQTLSDAGLFDSVETYTAYCIEHGTMVNGDVSTAGLQETIDFSGYDFPMATYCPHAGVDAALTAGGYTGQFTWVAYDSTGVLLVKSPTSGNLVSTTPPSWGAVGLRYTIGGTQAVWCFISSSTGAIGGTNVRNLAQQQSVLADTAVLNSSIPWTVSGLEAETTVTDGDNVAVVSSGGVGVASDVLENDYVQPFEPTDEQLAAGYSSADVLQGIETNTGEIAEATGDIATDLGSILTAITTTIGGTLNDIKTGVNGLENVIGTAVAGAANTVVTGVGEAVGALGDVVGDISTTLDNVWNGAQSWWADVLAWLGATPLAQLIAQIIAAVNAGVMTLEGAISAVQSWISAGVAEIVGAIEGIGELIPGGAAQEEPAEPQPGTGVALPPNGLLPSFELDLRSKAPFAYIVAFFETFQDAANTFSNNPSFYLDLKIPSVDENGLDPDGDELRFDAGEWLNYDVNGVSIAFIIRVLVTASICAGLIYVMYNAYLYAFRQ